MKVIYVGDNLNMEEAEGARLTDDLIVGSQIAGGAQVGQFAQSDLSTGFVGQKLASAGELRKSSSLFPPNQSDGFAGGYL